MRGEKEEREKNRRTDKWKRKHPPALDSKPVRLALPLAKLPLGTELVERVYRPLKYRFRILRPQWRSRLIAVMSKPDETTALVTKLSLDTITHPLKIVLVTATKDDGDGTTG